MKGFKANSMKFMT